MGMGRAKTTKMSPSEGEIQRSILTLLEIRKIPSARINSGQIFTGRYKVKLAPEGFPDILFFFKGVHAVEVKRPGKGLEPAQIEWRDILTKQGVGHLVAYSVEDVSGYINALIR